MSTEENKNKPKKKNVKAERGVNASIAKDTTRVVRCYVCAAKHFSNE